MIYNIRKLLKNRQNSFIGSYKKSSVMILLEEINGEIYIIFELRALNLRHQPGDICLPGGKLEDGESPKEGAIRETMEELNLKREDIEVIGSLDYAITPYNLIIYPFIAHLKHGDIKPNPNEVDHIFRVPLKFFLYNEPALHYVSLIQKPDEDFPFDLIRNGANYKFRTGRIPEYFYIFKDYVIWGFTAIIIKTFVDILKNSNDK